MSRFDFRVKLDLYKYYQDARRFCWIFVDGTKMLDVSHLKRHITRLLSIEEPFYLLLNDHEYLPPNEDIRILKENERILVVPGTGLETQSLSMEVSPIKENSFLEKRERTGTPVEHKEIQTISYSINHKEPKEILEETPKLDDVSDFPFNGYQPGTNQLDSWTPRVHESVVKDCVLPDITGSSSFHTLLEETEPETSLYKTIVESDTVEDSSALDILVPIPKKKRIRKRKQKVKVSNAEEPKKTDSNVPSKPKIISTCMIPMGKHIRFVNADNDERVTNTETPVSPTPANGICQSNMEHEKLSALLSLGKSSTPLTFTSRNSKKTSTEEVSDSEILSSSTNVTPEKIKNQLFNDKVEVIDKTENTLQSIIDSFTETSAHKYATATEKIHDKDIIAFKMLKMGADYTPQVSNYIIAEVLSTILGELSKYNLKILRGSEEIETPVGKFTLEEETDDSTKIDTILLNYIDLIQPRLLHTANSVVKTSPSP